MVRTVDGEPVSVDYRELSSSRVFFFFFLLTSSSLSSPQSLTLETSAKGEISLRS